MSKLLESLNWSHVGTLLAGMALGAAIHKFFQTLPDDIKPPPPRIEHLGVQLDERGWPKAHVLANTTALKAQTGVISRNDLPHGAFSSVLLKGLSKKSTVNEIKKILSNLPQLSQRILQDEKDRVKRVEELKKQGKSAAPFEVHSSTSSSPSTGVRVSGHESGDDRLVFALCIDSQLWNTWDSVPPNQTQAFTNITTKSGESVLFPATGEHLLLFIKSTRTDLCYELHKRFLQSLGLHVEKFDYTPGFGYRGGRDITGFIDGTRQPDHLLKALMNITVIHPQDEGSEEKSSRHEGGSYVYAGKFVHNLPKFEELSSDEKSAVVGRHYDKESVHSGFDDRIENPAMEVEPPTSHVQRGFGAIYRQAYPYAVGQSAGLYFIAFARHQFLLDTALKRMAGHFSTDGSVDAILNYTQAVTSNYYYAPSLEEIRALALPSSDKRPTTDSKVEKKSHEEEKKGKIKVFVEYCTQCGYVDEFQSVKSTLEELSHSFEVIGNATKPRQSSFEVVTESGQVLWSKLAQPEGHNNVEGVFPTAQQLREAVERFKLL